MTSNSHEKVAGISAHNTTYTTNAETPGPQMPTSKPTPLIVQKKSPQVNSLVSELDKCASLLRTFTTPSDDIGDVKNPLGIKIGMDLVHQENLTKFCILKSIPHLNLNFSNPSGLSKNPYAIPTINSAAQKPIEQKEFQKQPNGSYMKSKNNTVPISVI